jgi:hypothetical protein
MTLEHRMKRTVCLGICSLALVVGITSTARAEMPEDEAWMIGFYVGNYDPDPDVLDDDATFGGRVDFLFNRKFAVGMTLGLYESENTISGSGFSGSVDVDLTLLDLTAYRIFRGDKKVSPMVGAGAGTTFSSTDLNISGPGFSIVGNDLDDDSLTANIVLGTSIQLGNRFWLHPAAKLRWYEARESDETDREIAVHFLWRVGK